MSAWLNRQRKADLLTLAERAGLDDTEGLRKDELAALLEEYLNDHATTLRRDPSFNDYYDRTSSPTKRDAGPTSDGEVKTVVRKRRVIKVKSEPDASDGPSPSSPIPEISITPAPARNHATPHSHASAPHVSTFPPSPAVVTDAIENQTRRLSAVANDVLVATHAQTTLYQLREVTSSVIGVETVILLLEGFCVQRRMIPWRYAFDLPASSFIGTPSTAVFLPDFFVLLTDVYWSTTMLWAISAFWIPLAVSWLFNLTMRPVIRHGVVTASPRMHFDPLMFNVVKALLAWMIWSLGARFFGLFSDQTVDLVTQSMPAGYPGVMVGAFIGMLVSLYDAAQRK